MLRKYFLSIIIFICFFLLAFISLSAQEKEGEIIIISDWIGKVIQTEKHLYQNLSIHQTVNSDSGETPSKQDVVYKEPGIAFFGELIGKPFPSINIDFRINKSSRFSLGIVLYTLFSHNEPDSLFSGWSESEDVGENMPNIMYYYFVGKRNSRLEIGGGFSVRPVWDKDINGDFPLAFHGVIGYRYQKKKGFLFRAGYAPSYWPDAGFSPRSSTGISFGYSF